MSIKSSIFTLSIIILIALIYNIAGVGITFLVIASMFLIQAILFSIKKDHYDKYISFTNPSLYNLYIEKGSKFINKKRKDTIICYYISSIMISFCAYLQIKLTHNLDTRPLFSLKGFLLFTMIAFFIIIIIDYTCILIIKKSKTSTQELALNIILGLVLCIIVIVIVFMQSNLYVGIYC